MAAEVHIYQAQTGTGTDTITFNDVGFTPNCAIVFSTNLTSEGSTDDQAFIQTFGCWASKGTQWCSYQRKADGGTSAAYKFIEEDYVSTQRTSGGTLKQRIEIQSVTAGSATLNIPTNDTKRRYLIFVFMELNDAWVGTAAKPTSASTQTISDGSDLNFTPAAVIVAGKGSATAPPAVETSMSGSIGFATSTATSDQAAVNFAGETGTNTWTTRHSTGDCLTILDENTQAVTDDAHLSSLDSGSFDITFSSTTATANYIGYMAVEGDVWSDNDYTHPTSTGDDTQHNSGVGFEPDAVLELSSALTAVNTIDTSNANIMIGAASNEGTVGNGVTWNQGTGSDTDRRFQDDATINVRNSSATALNKATISAFGSDGFTRNFSNADGSNSWKGSVIAFAKAAAVSYVPYPQPRGEFAGMLPLSGGIN